MKPEEKETIHELIKLFTSDDYNPESLPLFQEWLANRANEEEKDTALFDAWNVTADTGSVEHAERVFEKVKRRAGISRGRRVSSFIKSGWNIAAMLALPLFILSGIWLYNNRTDKAGSGLTATVVKSDYLEDGCEKLLLGDGSQVWVAEAAIVTPDGKRETTLIGDALYDVKREYVSGERFTVHTEHLTATVLGTIFRVTALPGAQETIITLYEGTLEISTQEGSYIVESGTKFIYDNRCGEYITEDIGDLWPEQVERKALVFSTENISEVFSQIEKLYGITVDMAGYSWSSDRVTLKFPSSTNLENVLYMLAGISGNFEYRITDERIYIYDK